MQITHLGHSTVLVQTEQARILIDPGVFSHTWRALTDLDAVLVTHQHPDHIDVEQAPELAQANPAARWYVEPAVVGMLPQIDTHPVSAGDEVRIGDVAVTGVGGVHALIHGSLPRVGNTGLVLDAGARLFHPGDAVDTIPQHVDVAAVPLNGPWCKMAECIDFVRALAPTTWFPIHDALLSPQGRSLYLDRTAAISGFEATDLAAQEPLSV